VPRGHKGDLLVIGLATVVWAGLCGAVLLGTGSKLPRQVLRRAG
jgi:hypothetical protein